MKGPSRFVWIGFWLITLALFAGATALLFTYTPEVPGELPIQKMFYPHLPVAINTFVACLVVFVASIGYLWQRKRWWDDLAVAAAKVAVLFGAIVLATGMIWAKLRWTAWWTWSPRLTFSLLLWLLYVVYLMLRSSIESRDRRALVAAVYGIVAFLDVPLVWLSAKLLPDIHPESSPFTEPAMKVTLAVWFVPVTMLAIGLIVGGFVRARRLLADPANPSPGASGA